MYLFLDTETTGLPKSYNAPLSDFDNWPRLVQLSFLLFDKSANRIQGRNYIIRPEGFEIPEDASKIHGITTAQAIAEGVNISTAFKMLFADMEFAGILVGHNIEFDSNIIGSEIWRTFGKEKYDEIRKKYFGQSRRFICTMKAGVNFCELPGKIKGSYKWPRLGELYAKLFPGLDFADKHNSAADVKATAECFFEMKRRGIIRL